MSSTARKVGRPSLSGTGPAVKILLPLAPDFLAELRDLAEITGQPVTEILRRAAAREVRRLQRQMSSSALGAVEFYEGKTAAARESSRKV